MSGLSSPGVQVSIIDQSQYLPGATNSTPLVLLATAQNKADPTSTSVASGTTAANANKLFQVTSQRDLVSLYGNPFFYTTSDGTPIQGYELNEYGLLAAYSALGVTNSVYCLRADIDLSALIGKTGRPSGNPANGAYWLDTTNTTWGINVFNAVTNQFVYTVPDVITSTLLLSGNTPLASYGNIGDYAVVAIPNYGIPSLSTSKMFFYKNSSNTWVHLGGKEWKQSVPTVQATNSNPTLTVGNTLTLGLSGAVSATITVEASPNNVISVLAAQINALNFTYLSAAVVSGKLQIYSSQTGGDPAVNPKYLTVAGTGTILTDIGLTAGTFYEPELAYGTSAQMPLWGTSQTYPRPSGSVWIRVGTSATGFNPVISQWNSTTTNWVAETPNVATSDWDIIAQLDATGGQAIPAGTVYSQYNFDTYYNRGPIYYWERLTTGPTVITGSVTTPSFTTGGTLYVQITIPGTSSTSSAYAVTLGASTAAIDFVTAWSAASIPFTTATVTTSGAIQITHTAGGTIFMADYSLATGLSSGIIAQAGFIANSTSGCVTGPFHPITVTGTQTSTTGVGTGLQVRVNNNYQTYNVYPATSEIITAGSGYAVGDRVTFVGTEFGGATPANDLVITIASVNGSGGVTSVTYYSGVGVAAYCTQLTNWVPMTMTASGGAPVAAPTDGTPWFYSVVDQVDIMVNTSGGWKGYGIGTR